jgi:hypothetical protein
MKYACPLFVASLSDTYLYHARTGMPFGKNSATPTKWKKNEMLYPRKVKILENRIFCITLLVSLNTFMNYTQ